MIPKVRYSAGKYQRETVPFLGLNRSDDVREGEFSHQVNLSGRRYPFLAPRLPREKTVYDPAPTALFAWDGKEIMVSGGQLLYDGKALCNITDGEKQFAVVNTSLIVHPDMIIVDLEKGIAEDMTLTVTNGGTAVLSGNTLTLQPDTLYAANRMRYTSASASGHWIWTYAEVSWSEENGWVLTDPQLINCFDESNLEGRAFIPEATYNETTNKYALSTPPSKYYDTGTSKPTGYPEPAPANDLGFYGVFVSLADGEEHYWGLNGSAARWELSYYWEQLTNNVDLTERFSAGEYVDISGSGNTKNDRTLAKLSAVDASSITIEGESFAAQTTTNPVTIKKSVPKLDYICESANRLWGVSNADKTIYASALGMPGEFYDYSGEDNDSYAVAVGSEGDFTGICAYGNAVLCFKERMLHKVLGSMPSEYATAEYHFSGVKSGAHKSIVNVGETLFYLSPDGVCAYGGNLPTVVSRRLGSAALSGGVGGTDGRNYYLSAQRGGEWELLVYDTETGLWSREDGTHTHDFCRIGSAVKFLADDAVNRINAAGGETVEWEGVLTPFYETLRGRKNLGKLILRVEVPTDGYIAADVRFDGGCWIQAGIAEGGRAGTKLLPIPMRRCDKFEIRIRGKGDGAVLDMLREFKVRGEDR